MRSWLLVWSMLATLPAWAQSFTATTNTRSVPQNGTFELSFRLADMDASTFSAPALADFDVVSGPNRSSRVQIINGNSFRETTFSYVLAPRKSGTLTIAPATVRVGGQTLRTQALTITVTASRTTPGAPGASGAAPELFVRAELSTPLAYPGQQVLLDYRLYTRLNVDNYNFAEEPDFPDFYAENIRRYNNPSTQVDINGQTYTTKILRRYALYPQQVGQLTVPTSRIQLGVVRDQPPQRRSFFFRRATQPVFESTETVTLLVEPLPTGAPASFSGAVGNSYNLQTRIFPKTLTTDDDLRIELTVTGNADNKRVEAPELELPPGFEVYDPAVGNERNYENMGMLFATKTFSYTVLPTEVGQFAFSPAFTYFDPDSSRYVTLRADPTTVTVRAGTGTRQQVTTADAASATEALRPLKTDPALVRYEPPAPFFGTLPFWALLIAPFLVAVGAIRWHQYRHTLPDTTHPDYRRREAERLARERLARAERHLAAGESSAFYDEIARASLGYVAERLGIPNAELNRHNIRTRMAAKGVAATTIDQLMRIFENCEMARFAGMDNRAAMQQTYTDTRAVLTSLAA